MPFNVPTPRADAVVERVHVTMDQIWNQASRRRPSLVSLPPLTVKMIGHVNASCTTPAAETLKEIRASTLHSTGGHASSSDEYWATHPLPRAMLTVDQSSSRHIIALSNAE